MSSPSPLLPRPARLLALPQLSNQRKGALLLLLAIVIWGTNWPVMKLGLHHITPLWFSATRFALGGITLFALQLLTGTLRLPTRRDIPLIFSVGLLQMLAFTALGAIAMTQISAGRSAVLAYTTPLWVVPAALLFFRERISRRELIGTLIGIGGVAILFNPLTLNWSDSTVVKANLMLLTASLCWALCILHIRYSKGHSSAYHLAPWQMLLATLPLIGIARWVEGPYSGDGSGTFWAVAMFVGPLATAFCFCAVNAASRRFTSTQMSSAMLGVPLVGLLMSVVFLGEHLSLGLALGVVTIISGMLIVTCKSRSNAASNNKE